VPSKSNVESNNSQNHMVSSHYLPFSGFHSLANVDLRECPIPAEFG